MTDKELFDELTPIFHEGCAEAHNRDIVANRDLLILERGTCAYPEFSLKELAYMAGFATSMVGKLAALYFTLVDAPKQPGKFSNN